MVTHHSLLYNSRGFPEFKAHLSFQRPSDFHWKTTSIYLFMQSGTARTNRSRYAGNVHAYQFSVFSLKCQNAKPCSLEHFSLLIQLKHHLVSAWASSPRPTSQVPLGLLRPGGEAALRASESRPQPHQFSLGYQIRSADGPGPHVGAPGAAPPQTKGVILTPTASCSRLPGLG